MFALQVIQPEPTWLQQRINDNGSMQELGVSHPLQRPGAAGCPKGFVRPLCS